MIPNENSNLINSINLSNLSADEQNKLINISNLQNMIKISQNQVSSFSGKDTRGETNLRREKDLTEREKIELEMKKWKKEQKKVLKLS
jgi:predicted  nucleic acid-binding Zn-ribbon protein